MNFRDGEKKFLQVLRIRQKINDQFRKLFEFSKKFRSLWLRLFDFIVISGAYIIAQILAEDTIPYLALTSSMVWKSIIVATILYMSMFRSIQII